MGLWRSLTGSIRVRIISADIPGILKRLTEKKILLQDITYESDLSIIVTIQRRDFNKTEYLLTERGDRCQRVKRWGAYWTVHRMGRRPILLIGITLLVVLTFYIPSKIFFIQVQGNHTVSSLEILEKAERIGLSFGCDRKGIQNEEMKNYLLEEIPKLDWVGITTSGCVAIVEVKETVTEAEKNDSSFAVSSLVARCDGVIESITVTNGTPLCRPGQAVRRGQVLISGYQDLGLVVKATHAEGDVYARTYRYIQSVSPLISTVRTGLDEIQTKFSLQIGKKLINFFQGSGISHAGCVKMYAKEYLSLPGGFQLPVALITEKQYAYTTSNDSSNKTSFAWMERFADQYIQNQMLAGELLNKQITTELLDDVYVLSGSYACREQIGINRNEESLDHNGENS